ncbi:MAG TPA: hypothetical protein DD791_08050 [Syntrophomonas sp.]|jgi:hypothetical protein|nr:hypothetical protein [Syntrophomonas sp.]
MKLNSRLQKLEQQIPPVPEPKPDLSGLSIDELRLMAQYRRDGHQFTEEEQQQRLEAISEKIVWR